MYRTDSHEDRSLLLFGHDKQVIAYRRDTGEIAWTFTHENAYGYYVDFVVVERRVLVAVGSSITCLDYATGAVIGITPLPSDVLRIMLDDNHLYAFGDDDIYCVDTTGRIVWRRKHSLYTSSTMPTFGFPGNIIHGFRDSG